MSEEKKVVKKRAKVKTVHDLKEGETLVEVKDGIEYTHTKSRLGSIITDRKPVENK